MSQNVTQNAETAEENAERKKKKKRKRRRRRRDGDQLKTQAAPDPGRAARRDLGRGARPGSRDPGGRATQVAARRTQVAHLVFFFFFFPSSNTFFSGFFFLLPWVFCFFFFLSSPMKTLVLPLWFFFVFFLNGNRVLETRFPCRHHLKKVPRKRHATHKNRALKTRFRSPKSSL